METDDGVAVESAALLLIPSINTPDDQSCINLKTSVQNRRTSSVSRVSISDDAAATLSFDDINYAIGGQMKPSRKRLRFPTFPCSKPKEYKQILANVSGNFANGMNAILGRFCGMCVLVNQ
jgi:hypothetical protein